MKPWRRSYMEWQRTPTLPSLSLIAALVLHANVGVAGQPENVSVRRTSVEQAAAVAIKAPDEQPTRSVGPASPKVLQRQWAPPLQQRMPSEVELRMAAAEPEPRKKATPTNKQKRRAETNRRKQQTLARQEAEQRAAEELKRATAERIKELLALAQRDYAEGRLLEPPKNNAADRYQEVLALDPTQLAALAGAQRLIEILAAEAERTAAAGDKDRTRQYISRIRALRPEDASLKELDARLQALNASPVVLSDRQQERYSRSAQSIERAYEHLQQQPLDMQAIDQAIDEYDRAAGLVAHAPGLPMLKDRIIIAFPAATQAELARDNSRRALRVVKMARERGWLTPELESLERTVKAGTLRR